MAYHAGDLTAIHKPTRPPMKPAAQAMPITTDAAIGHSAQPPLKTGQAVTLYAAPQGYRALQLAAWQRAAPGRWLV
ncbi:MAG: hypothetical protein FJX22_04295, partial [Alphaproteobacteria bacterium]|nr:hypothetical protein [Alphaproteobacteria bacterium]